MPPSHVYVKRNPIHPYTYNNPDDLPYIQWKFVRISVAYGMYTSKQIGWERAKREEYEQWCKQMEELKEKK
ncbi:MAG: hypothetical protein Tp172DCM1112201_54 [Prokaryotic dsDNA virus sp.]|nr:MAG: hypothetical protein Tp172DCM1112201_54 [Prokaryotic dsDNA virus sp.]|tara:strand:+ start:1226 stop:1438 length:213 start_codon:yes stop_codon:yes gene_type:complete